MMPPYSQLIGAPLPSLAESRHGYSLITERHVQVIWLEQKYFRPLSTVDGVSIEVISPGIWNAEAGPDFKKAHLIIGGTEIYGDVEIHLSDEGWRQHEHHNDPRYNQVALHLSFWKSRQSKPLSTSEGKIIPQGYFEEFLTIPVKRIANAIDLDLYPYKKCTGSGKCSKVLFQKFSRDETVSFFRSAAEWRLEKKRKHLHMRTEDERLYLGAGLAMALGYKQNSESFLDLFLQMRQGRDKPFEELLATALGSCGFFSESHRTRWAGSPYYQELMRLYLSQPAPSEKSIKLILAKVRPLNHPVRRIAYLVHLVKDSSLPQLYQRMEAHWEASWPMIKGRRANNKLYMELLQMLPSYEDSYWNHHYTFEMASRDELLPLVGSPLKGEIVINAFFPLLHESIASRGNSEEMKAFKELFAGIRAQQTGKGKYLKHRFWGDAPGSSLLAKADILQGAYQLHYDFCLHYEASCEGCPFVERYLGSKR